MNSSIYQHWTFLLLATNFHTSTFWACMSFEICNLGWWCLKRTRLIFEHTYSNGMILVILVWILLELSLLLHFKVSIWRWWPLLIKRHDSSNQTRLAIYTSHWIHGVGKVMNLGKPWCLKYYYLASFLIDVYLESSKFQHIP